MNNLLPRKHQRVELQRSLHADRRHPTWVEEVRFPLVLVVPPMEREHPVPLARGEQVQLHYSDGRGDLTLVGLVWERPRRGEAVPIQALEVTRVQRRRFFRWQGQYPVWFLVAGTGAGEQAQGQQWQAGYTFDVSAGGLSIRWDEELPPGTPLLLEVRLGNELVRAEGQVVRTLVNREGGPGRYLVGVEFTRISEANQGKIMRFIFSQEVRLRRR